MEEKQCPQVKVRKAEFSYDDLPSLVSQYFTQEAWFTLELPEDYLSGPVEKLPFSRIKDYGFLSVFSAETELLVDLEEKVCQIVTEGSLNLAGQEEREAYVRDTQYRLRKHAKAEVFFRYGKALIHREYFIFDKDMLVLFASRMSGIAKR